MSLIRILPEKIASQIAAGEVVTRPSSVVRELLDNSIDARATRIAVRIEGGGRNTIRVTDNGTGMNKDDILLCIERHATSKIKTADDLFAVRTLGFRGEALPSIASVSRLKITSRHKDDMVGHTLFVEGGELRSMEETGAPTGTTVDVRNLFFNVPARRKFLRTPKTEGAHVYETMVRGALPFTGIHFSLEDEKKTIIRLPATGDIIHRLSLLMGSRAAESIIEEENRIEGLTIKVFLADPQFSRKRGDRLFVYVNKRNIKDRFVTKAILEGYGQRLMKGQYPQAAIFIEIDPSMVDVNVHPAKEDVKFHDSFKVFRAIVATVGAALSRTVRQVPGKGYDPPWSFLGHVREDSQGDPDRFSFEESKWVVEEDAGDRPDIYFNDFNKKDAPMDSRRLDERPSSFKVPGNLFEGSYEQEGIPRVIGQLGTTYVLCETGSGLLLVDQHAAHERLVYEDIKRAMDTHGVPSQMLVTPVQIELSAREKALAMEFHEELEKLGIDIEHFGGNTFLLRSYPVVLKKVNWESLLPEILMELRKNTGIRDAMFHDVISVMACHSAIRAHHRMSMEEMEHLIARLFMADLPTNCPHGRPVFKEITYREIEKMFKRVV